MGEDFLDPLMIRFSQGTISEHFKVGDSALHPVVTCFCFCYTAQTRLFVLNCHHAVQWLLAQENPEMSIFDTFDQIAAGMQKREVPMMRVVLRGDNIVTLDNRRLAVYKMARRAGVCGKVKVTVVPGLDWQLATGLNLVDPPNMDDLRFCRDKLCCPKLVSHWPCKQIESCGGRFFRVLFLGDINSILVCESAR